MARVEVSRVVGEVFLAENDTPGITRVETQVAAEQREANSSADLKVTRVVGETLLEENPTPGVTRVETQVAAEQREANSSANLLVTRVVGEHFITDPPEAGVTRVETQVAAEQREANSSADLKVTRVVGEIFTRQVISDVAPLPLNDDSEIFLHDWASAVRLRTSFQTSVRNSPDTGASARRSATLKPFRTMVLRWLEGPTRDGDKARLDRLEVFLRRITDGVFQVPVYMDQVELGTPYGSGDDTLVFDTSQGRFFNGGRVAIVEVDAFGEVTAVSYHLIDEVTPTGIVLQSSLGVSVSDNALLFPLMDCECLLEVQVEYQSAQVVALTLEIQEVAGASALPPLFTDTPDEFDEFDGLPIFDIEPDWAPGIRRGRSRQGRSIAQGRGTLNVKEATRSREVHDFLLSGDRDDMWPVIRFFESRRGMLRPFWLIDQSQVFDVAELDASGNFVSISEIGDFSDFEEEWNWIGLVFDDIVYVRPVVTIQQVMTVFRLTVSPILPTNLDETEVLRAARARKVIFASDELEESWEHTGYMSTRLAMVEVLDENSYST